MEGKLLNVIYFIRFVLDFITKNGMDGLLELMSGMGSEDR